MKNNNMNPWPIIRWAGALTVYVLTVAIAVSMVRSRDRDFVEMKADLDEKIESNQKKAKREMARARDSEEGAVEKLTVENQGLTRKIKVCEAQMDYAESRVSNARKLGHAEADLEGLKGKGGASNSSSETPTSPAYRTPALPAVTTASMQTYSNPVSKALAAKEIKRAALEKWKDDYSMVDYEIGKQTDAYETLQQYSKNYRSDVKAVVSSAAQKWGTDYGMVVYEIEKQLDAKDRVAHR